MAEQFSLTSSSAKLILKSLFITLCWLLAVLLAKGLFLNLGICSSYYVISESRVLLDVGLQYYLSEKDSYFYDSFVVSFSSNLFDYIMIEYSLFISWSFA